MIEQTYLPFNRNCFLSNIFLTRIDKFVKMSVWRQRLKSVYKDSVFNNILL